MNYLFSRTYETMAQLKYMVSLWTTAQQNAATLTDGEGVTILDYDDLMGEISDRYFSYKTILHHSEEVITPAQGANMIFSNFARWKSERLDNIRRAWEAINEEYNPLYNYDRYEAAAHDKDETEHGRKVATNSDIKEETNTDYKESTNTDSKVSHNMDTKTERASDLKTEHATNIKASTASDIKSSVNTDVTETEGQALKTDIRPTWAADEQTTAKETTKPGDRHTTGEAASNYTQTSGLANNNYTQTEGQATGNYDRVNGIAASNYDKTTASSVNNFDRTEGSEQNNYIHKEGDASDNYNRTYGDDSDNYTQESGKTTIQRDIGARHMYGNIGTTKTQEMMLDEINARKINFKHMLIDEWVHTVAYSLEVVS